MAKYKAEIEALQAQRAKAVESYRALHQKAKTEKRSLTAHQNKP